jgi:hypothetical protein
MIQLAHFLAKVMSLLNLNSKVASSHCDVFRTHDTLAVMNVAFAIPGKLFHKLLLAACSL